MTNDNTDAWLATMEPTRRQTLSALTVAAIILLGFCVLAPLADTQLLRLDAFIPSFEAIVFVTDLITSILLFSQFSIYYSRALLALACGYLFTALIIIPHLLTLPGRIFAGRTSWCRPPNHSVALLGVARLFPCGPLDLCVA